MRNYFLSTIVTIFFFSGSLTSYCQQHKGDSFNTAKKTKSANVVYVYEEIKGFALTSSNGQQEGILIEIMNAFEAYVKKTYGITINSTYKLISNDNFSQYLNEIKNSNGGIFGLNTTTINEERKSFLKFSPPFINNISLLITHNSVPTLSSFNNISSEFANFTAYSAPETTYEKRVIALKKSHYPSLKVKNVGGESEIVKGIINDKTSFGFIDISYYLQNLKTRKDVKRHPAGDQAGEQYGIVMPLNSDWDGVLADFMNSGYLKSGEYRQAVIHYLGKEALRMMD